MEKLFFYGKTQTAAVVEVEVEVEVEDWRM